MGSDLPDSVQQTPERNSRPFLKAMGLALIVIVPILVVAATSVADPAAAGERAGALSVAPFLGGLAVGVWAKLALRRWHWLDYVLRFALCTIALFGLNAFGRSLIPAAPPAPLAPAVDLTDAEKQNLSVIGGWVRHRTFSFTLPVGDKFALAPGLQNEMNRRRASLPGTFVWALANDAGDRSITVFVAKGLGDDERTFRGMTRAIGASTSKQAGRVLEDVVRWDRRAREFRHGVHLSSGLYVKTRCLPSSSTWNTPYINPSYIVCVQTLSPDSTDLDDARLHLNVPSRSFPPN
jgi:hypothetical protein